MDKEESITDPSIADPIGMSETFYEKIFWEIEGELQRILPTLLVRIDKYLS
jgi:hypothetical protein